MRHVQTEHKLMKSKKGISPLIATVLLIGFTVALAAVIMNWGFGFFKEREEDVERTTRTTLKCATELDFKINADCTNNKIVVDNGRSTVDIKKLVFRVHTGTSGDIIPIITETGVPAYGSKSFDLTLTGATKVEAIAFIPGENGEEIQCTQTLKELEVTC